MAPKSLLCLYLAFIFLVGDTAFTDKGLYSWCFPAKRTIRILPYFDSLHH